LYFTLMTNRPNSSRILYDAYKKTTWAERRQIAMYSIASFGMLGGAMLGLSASDELARQPDRPCSKSEDLYQPSRQEIAAIAMEGEGVDPYQIAPNVVPVHIMENTPICPENIDEFNAPAEDAWAIGGGGAAAISGLVLLRTVAVRQYDL
jgi:hypothetical protein